MNIAGILRHDEALNEAHDVELQGDLAFVPGKGGSIAFIDISDPFAPELVWFCRDEEALHDAETVLMADNRLYLGTDDFHSIDISDPAKPKFQAKISDRSRIRRINGMV